MKDLYTQLYGGQRRTLERIETNQEDLFFREERETDWDAHCEIIYREQKNVWSDYASQRRKT